VADISELPWFVAIGEYRGVVPDTLDVGLAPDQFRPWGSVTLTPYTLTTASGKVAAQGIELRLTELTPPLTVLLTPVPARIETGVLRLPRANAPAGEVVPPTTGEIAEQQAAPGVPLLANSELLELAAGTELVWRVEFGPVTILGASYTYAGFYFKPPTITAAAYAAPAWEAPEVDLTTVPRFIPAAA
jgi:hypothetical protein